MSLHVQGQVVAAGERPGAEVALEGLRPRVLAVVPRQLVGAGKLPAAAVPGALIRLLARVRPLVRLEVRALCVDFITAGKVAAVHLSFPQTFTVVLGGAAAVGGSSIGGGRYHEMLRAGLSVKTQQV